MHIAWKKFLYCHCVNLFLSTKLLWKSDIKGDLFMLIKKSHEFKKVRNTRISRYSRRMLKGVATIHYLCGNGLAMLSSPRLWRCNTYRQGPLLELRLHCMCKFRASVLLAKNFIKMKAILKLCFRLFSIHRIQFASLRNSNKNEIPKGTSLFIQLYKSINIKNIISAVFYYSASC